MSTRPTARSTRLSTATPLPAASIWSSGTKASARSSKLATKSKKFSPGDYVSCTVRRPGESIFDLIGRNDITSDEVYYERGINLCHGYLTEYFVDDAEYIVKVPQNLKHLGVLAEPASVCAKAIEQAFLAQQRLQVWDPKRAFVLGSGQIGLLATMMLQAARNRGPHHRHPAGAAPQVVNRRGLWRPLREHQGDVARRPGAAEVGKPDLIFEATGNAEVCFRAMEVLAHNGALIWTSITGGKHDVSIDAAKINIEWVLGNKLLVSSVNGNRRHFELGMQALSHGELTYPGVTGQDPHASGRRGSTPTRK